MDSRRGFKIPNSRFKKLGEIGSFLESEIWNRFRAVEPENQATLPPDPTTFRRSGRGLPIIEMIG
jgi:hypothetical protein